MKLTVEITSANLLPALIDAFRRNGCLADRAAPRRCRVVHAQARDEEEARMEIAFFLRAWQLRHPEVEAIIC
jgi:hypothetical protein